MRRGGAHEAQAERGGLVVVAPVSGGVRRDPDARGDVGGAPLIRDRMLVLHARGRDNRGAAAASGRAVAAASGRAAVAVALMLALRLLL